MASNRIDNLTVYDAARLGLSKGHINANIQGTSQSISTSFQSLVDVYGLTLAFPSAATKLKVASTDATDASGNTGATAVRITGLNAALEEIYEDVVLSGTTPVETVGEFFRVNAFVAIAAGSNASNAGYVYCAATSDTFTGGIPTTPYSVITPDNGRALTGVYTVPGNTKAVPLHILYSAGASDEVHCVAQVRFFGGTVFYRELDIYAAAGVSGFYETRSGLALPAGTDVRIIARSSVSQGEFRISLALLSKLYDRDAPAPTNVGA